MMEKSKKKYFLIKKNNYFFIELITSPNSLYFQIKLCFFSFFTHIILFPKSNILTLFPKINFGNIKGIDIIIE